MEALSEHWGKDWDRVIELATEAIELDPNFPWPYSQRGVAHTVKGEYRLAIRDLNKAIDLDPTFDAAYTNRAITYMKLAQYKRAERDIKMAVKLNPDEFMAMVTMAELLTLNDKDAEACVWLNRAFQTDVRDVLSFVLSTDIFENIQYLPCYRESIDIE
jgi:tetratricopeptide (TPR) repeat protein